MASIYTMDGDTLTEGLQGCDTCDEAILAARQTADQRGESVHLSDDDGEWIVYPARADGSRAACTPTETPTCACTGCGCDDQATRTDDQGYPVCDECADYTVDEDGDVVCSRMTDGGTTCHVCEQTIAWGSIRTHRSGQPNDRTGTCGCVNHVWREEDRGGWQSPQRVSNLTTCEHCGYDYRGATCRRCASAEYDVR